MADELRIAHQPALRDPVLITAFRGWNDGGQGASLAGGYLAKTWAAARFAEIEPEGFFDFQATRPHVSFVEGTTRRIDWPDNAFYHASIPGAERVGVLHDACGRAGLRSVSLWAAVPHYVSLAPSPRAALALCQRLSDILGTDIDTEELDEAADRYSEQVSEAVASDEETSAYVAELEERAEILDDDQELPSGESLAAELTRFLRERERGNGGPESGP